jgi:uncharacterized membrane protein
MIFDPCRENAMTRKSHKLSIPMLLLVLAAVTTLLLPVTGAFAKSYRVSGVDIDARLKPNGDMDVVESRTYDFDGSFSFAYREIPIDGPVEFVDFKVSEGGRAYRLSDSGEPGTFTVERSGGKMVVTWYYRARSETRTFDLGYRARGAVRRHNDVALLYIKFIGEDWDIPQYNVGLTVRPPAGLIAGDIRHWLHGPLWASSRIQPDGTIIAECEVLPRNTFLEIRGLYPLAAFEGAPVEDGSVREQIMAEEARWAQEANEKREMAIERAAERKKRGEKGRNIGIGIGALGLAVWWGIFKTFRNKPTVPRTPGMTSEIPDDTPPALVSYLLYSRRIGGAALVATLLDLGRRGIINLREERVEKNRFWGGKKTQSEYHWDLDRAGWDSQTASMTEYENSLIAFLFNNIAGGADTVPIETIKKKRSDVIKFFRKWKKSVEKAGKQRSWFDERSIHGGYISLALGAGLMLLTALLVFLFGPWGLISAGAGLVVLLLSLAIPHRTAEGETRARQWQAVQKYLKTHEFRNTDRQHVLHQISEYLVYGVVLGLAEKYYKELAAYIPEGEHRNYVPWYVYHGRGSGQFSPDAFGQAFSSMIATTTSTMSSASGTGGGASGGGGGGAGGGGGGAG